MEQLEPYKVRPAPDTLPGCFETGTQSHEGMAGTAAVVDYFAWIGETMAAGHHKTNPAFSGRRRHVHAALNYLLEYEQTLSQRLIDGLQQISGVTIQGITSGDAMMRRVPTVSFTHADLASATIAHALAARNIFVWSGHNYAVEAAKVLGIYDSGGAVRVGPVHYNSPDEVDQVLIALEDIVSGR